MYKNDLNVRERQNVDMLAFTNHKNVIFLSQIFALRSWNFLKELSWNDVLLNVSLLFLKGRKAFDKPDVLPLMKELIGE